MALVSFQLLGLGFSGSRRAEEPKCLASLSNRAFRTEFFSWKRSIQRQMGQEVELKVAGEVEERARLELEVSENGE